MSHCGTVQRSLPPKWNCRYASAEFQLADYSPEKEQLQRGQNDKGLKCANSNLAKAALHQLASRENVLTSSKKQLLQRYE